APGPRRLGPSAHAPPLLCEPRAAVLAGPARGAGDARAREHFDHAGLHAPRLPGPRQGLRRGASARAPEMKSVTLKPGREKSLRRRHPWIFSGAIDKAEGAPGSGETVLIKSAERNSLALAAWSPQSQIRARVWTFDSHSSIEKPFFEKR